MSKILKKYEYNVTTKEEIIEEFTDQEWEDVQKMLEQEEPISECDNC